MKVRRLVRGGLASSAALLLLSGGAAIVYGAVRAHPPSGGASPVSSAAARQLSLTCRSPALGGRLPALVYLPSGYSGSGARYPVIYFLHGLPANPQSYTQNAFVAAALASAGRRAIVVAPQGARGRDAGSDREYLDWSPTENWPQAISHDLTACVDHRFHTLATRTGRALIGLSAGGYGAFNVGLRNLATFAAVESWSGYFVATDPSGYHALKFPSRAAQEAATVPAGSALAGELTRWPSLIGFYVGTGDNRFLRANRAYDTALRGDRIAHVFRTYPGGHEVALWQKRAPSWLGMALTYLSLRRIVAPDRGG